MDVSFSPLEVCEASEDGAMDVSFKAEDEISREAISETLPGGVVVQCTEAPTS